MSKHCCSAHFRHKNLQPRGGGGADIQGDCLILSKPVKQVNDTVLTVTICVIKENGSLTIDDEDTEVYHTHTTRIHQRMADIKYIIYAVSLIHN